MSQFKLREFFLLNARDGVSPKRVDQLVQEVYRRMGQHAAGQIGLSGLARDGRYCLGFETERAANLFEGLYREHGGTPRRTRQIPKGLRPVAQSDLLAVVAFLRENCQDPRHKAHLN